VPKFSIQPQDDGIFYRALRCQSILLKLFTLTTLPIKLVDDFFIQNYNRLESESNTALPNNGNDQSSQDTSSDYSILVAKTGLNSLRAFFAKAWTSPLNLNGILLNKNINLVNRFLMYLGQINMLFLCLISLFILLPRGAIDASSILKINLYNKARLMF
jgi:hypothetical protein